MSASTSNQNLHPTNPTLLKDVNVPKEKGQTRILENGSLLYREPITQEEVPAVRLDDIRSRLVKEESKKLSYRFPKKRGYEDTNVTAFVKKDYNYGPKRENRPDRLFQIQSDGAKGKKPDGYVMDEGRIVLDAFDHGLRNFGNQLPIYVSTELEGHDIEDYLRRNREISVYDLIARAPNGYYTGKPETEDKKGKKREKAREWHEGPPRVGTFSMRATRFRLSAGCLSWEKKDGTAAKNQRILDVIPAQYKTLGVNSTKGWRDLNKEEIKRIQEGAMRKPQQGRKGKRAAQAQKDLEEEEIPVDVSLQGEGFHEDGEEVQYEDEDAGIGTPREQDNGVWPEYDPEDYGGPMPTPHTNYVNPQIDDPWEIPNVMDENLVNIEYRQSQQGSLQSHKRSRGQSDAFSEEISNGPAQKRARKTADGQHHGNERTISRITTSRMGRQPQQVPAPKSYVAGGPARASISSTIGSNTLDQGSHPVFSDNGSDVSSLAPHGNRDQFCDLRHPASAGSMLSNIYNSNQQPWSGTSLQALHTQHASDNILQQHVPQRKPSNNHTQPNYSQADQVTSHSFGPNNGIAPELEALDGDVEDYTAESDFHVHGPPEYMPLLHEPPRVLPSEQGPWHHSPQPIYPMRQDDSQQLHPSSETNGKRKRTQSSTIGQPYGQRSIKRTKGHTFEPATAPDVPSFNEPVLRAVDYTPTTTFETPSPNNWLSETHEDGVFQTGTRWPDFPPAAFPSADVEPWNGEDFSFEGQGDMTAINNQQWMPSQFAPSLDDGDANLQTPGFAHMDPNVYGDPNYGFYPLQTSIPAHGMSFHTAPSTELGSGWLA